MENEGGGGGGGVGGGGGGGGFMGDKATCVRVCTYHFCTLCYPSSRSHLSLMSLLSGTPAPVHRSLLAGPLAEASDGPVAGEKRQDTESD